MTDPAYPPRLMRRHEAARYIGVSATTLEVLVAENQIAPGKKVRGCTVWDVRDLDAFSDALPYIGEAVRPKRGPVAI